MFVCACLLRFLNDSWELWALEWNGMQWSGMEWSRWNAMQCSGMEWSRWNALQWSGMEWMHVGSFWVGLLICFSLLVIVGPQSQNRKFWVLSAQRIRLV